jgi:hypothetical protein
MAKWADYLISAVRFERDIHGNKLHISHLKLHVDSEADSLGGGTSYKREEVVTLIDVLNKKIMTITKSKEGKWNPGARVFVVEIKRVKYLKTVSDNTEKDNLDNLPEF